MQGLKPEDMMYACARLIAGLEGPALQAALKWNPGDFNDTDGLEVWLRRLHALPTIRKAAPVAMQIVQDYMEL